jgi:DNA repair exonuclease SbcCD ATPase subunit
MSVRNWKAYDELAVDLTPGTTFLVARNGVGKTSFIESILWGLLGSEASDIDGETSRRGEGTATVSLDLQLPGRGLVTLTRRALPASGRGRPKEDVTFSHAEGDGQGDAAWHAVLTEAWQASPSLLGRLLILPEHAVWEELSSPAGVDINAAIRDLLRLDVLDELGDIAGVESRKAKKMVQESRAVSDRELQEARHVFQAARAEYDVAESEVNELRMAYANRKAQRLYADSSTKWETEHAQWAREQDSARVAVASALRDVVPAFEDPVPPAGADTDIAAAALIAVGVALENLDAEIAAARALYELSDRHRQDLSPDHDCPVCLRPMDRSTVQAAAERHSDFLQDLVGRLDRLAQTRSRTAAARDQLIVLQQRLSVSPPPAPTLPEPAVGPELDNVRHAASADLSDEELLAAGRAAAERAEQRRDALGVARSTLTGLEDSDRAWAAAVTASRRQGLSTLVMGASNRLSAEMTAQAANPLLQLVRDQWKKLPLGDALDIDDTGLISVLRRGRRLNYRCMSGGEKAQAVLIYRVAALKALSAAPVLLLDEPLEHLDPRNRWRYGRMLASLSGSGALNQTLVTTYEEPLARRLAYQADRDEQSGAVTLRYLTGA